MSKVKKAIALKYMEGYQAPIITAKGFGYIADKIIEKAEESNVPVMINEEMASLLDSVTMGDYIPIELYGAVAEIIAYIMEIDGSILKK